jgi:restriction system protein
MKNYIRVMLGRKSVHAQECVTGGFIGTDYNFRQDLSGKLPEEWRMFNKEFIPVYLANNPGKSRVAAGLACGMTWTIAKGLQKGDIVLSPDGQGHYHVGEISGDYHYKDGGILPHRRPVHWFTQTINRSDMSQELRYSAGAIGTTSNLNHYVDEIEGLLGGATAPKILSTDETVENPSEFAMEKHLEDFLAQNWKQTEFGKDYNIFEEEGEIVGKQYLTDTGPIDILAVSKDKKTLLVIELKKGRASDVVVGQIMRYIGYVKDELAEDGQTVKGIIIALENDQRIRRALSAAQNIEFYRYEVRFKLVKA